MRMPCSPAAPPVQHVRMRRTGGSRTTGRTGTGLDRDADRRSLRSLDISFSVDESLASASTAIALKLRLRDELTRPDESG
ncbi:hypothetical protein [Paenibacillus caseinilyticus]|uniref:hypothetical protein n=1 Tax=Paenibacillus caseinilyticus TaxID=3098138 RepID=UPI0022B8BBD0|nr:hypothetical protein [Paenibacillus caseinilyticus]MCZ8521978.1 hypothetical protein [Paenibacillus caseinilyticus]